MSIVVDEKPDVRRGKDGESYIFTYNVFGTEDPLAAVAAAKAEVPEVFADLVRQRPDFQEVGPEHYEVTFTFGKSQKQQPSKETGQVSRDFQVGTETVRITTSRATVASYARAGETAPNCKQLIGIEDDGTVQGVDVHTPVATFGYTIRPENPAVNQAYEILAGQLVGKVNLTTFLGRPPGTVLCVGLSGGERSDDDSELRLEFAYRENRTSITIGDISSIAKDGWDYLWVLYRKVERDLGGGKKVIVQEPIAVYIEEVFARADLNALLI